MAGGTPNDGGRVTTQEFYQAQLNTNEKIAGMDARQSDERVAMERRIMDELKGVPKQVETNTKEIDILRKSSNVKDLAIAIGAFIGTAISVAIGNRQ